MNTLNNIFDDKENKTLQQLMNNNIDSNIEKNIKYSLDNNIDIVNFFNPDIPLPIYFQIPRKKRIIVLLYLLLVQIICNLDRGIYFSNEKHIKKYYNINHYFLNFQVIENIGKLIGTVVYYYLLNKISSKQLFIICMIGRGAFIFCIIWIIDFPYFISIFKGFFNVFFFIYLPLWCDQYGDSNKRTIMLTLIQTGFPLGILFGYIIGNLFYGKWSELYCFNGFLYFFLCIFCFTLNKKYFNMKISKGFKIYEDDSGLENEKIICERRYSIFEILNYIFNKKYFIFTTLSITIGIFTLNCFFYYHLDYIKEIYNVKVLNTENILYRIINIMFFPLGMLFGGIIGYLIGEYGSKIWFFISSLFSFFCYLSICFLFIIKNLIGYYICISIFFFFHGAKYIIEIGILFNTVHLYIKAETSCLISFFFHLFGNLPSNFVFGLIYHYTSMKFSLFFCSQISIFGTIFTVFALYYRYYKKNKSLESLINDNENDFIMIEK